MAAPELASARVSAPAFGPRLRWSLAFFCMAVLVLLALQVVLHGPMLAVDQEVSHFFAAHRERELTEVMLFVSQVHMTLPVLAATAAIAFFFARRGDRASMRLLVVVPIGMLLNVALKDTFRRARPNWDDPLVQLATYSFPSGHALASTVFYGIVCVLVFMNTRSRFWRTFAAVGGLAMVLLVCFSRVYLGAHYPVDVVAGIAEGCLCLLAVVSWLRR